MAGLFSRQDDDSNEMESAEDQEFSVGEEYTDSTQRDDVVMLTKSKYDLMRKALHTLHDNIGNILKLLDDSPKNISEGQLREVSHAVQKMNNDLELAGNERVLEGVFTGESMISNDGHEYPVPPNYASKSKLVEGDILKLTITPGGDFKYKQIGPVERDRVTGTLGYDEEGNYLVTADGKSWRVLAASVTYFKGEEGDQVVILVPREAESNWAAVENIIK